jgi:hypothetical protein
MEAPRHGGRAQIHRHHFLLTEQQKVEKKRGRYFPVTKEKAGADGTAAWQHRGTTAPACATPHFQHLMKSFPHVWPPKHQGEEVATTAQVISSLGERLTQWGRARLRDKISLGEVAESGAADRLPCMATTADSRVHRDHAATPPATHYRGSEGNN